MKITTKSGELIPFTQNPVQRELIKELGLDPDAEVFDISNMRIRLRVLKSRRQGVTTLLIALIFLDTYNHNNRRSVAIAQDLEATQTIFEIATRYYNNLPDHMKIPAARSNTRELVWPSIDSRFYVETCNKSNVGSGATLHNVLKDERAKWNLPASEIKSVDDSLDEACSHGNIFEPSTAFGMNHFKVDWDASVNGQNRFKPVFIPWFHDPTCVLPITGPFVRTEEEEDWVKLYNLTNEQINWYRDKKLDRKERMDQEYPCLAPDTLLSTNRGIIPIMEILIGDITESGEVTQFFENPPLPVYKLTTYMGRVLRGTAEHPIATKEDFIAISDLEVGQSIILRPPRFAENIFVVKWQDPPLCNHEIQITEDVARFLGFFAGDGSWYKGCISFVCDAKDQDMVKDIIELVRSIVGGNPTTRNISRVQGRAGATEVRVNIKNALTSMVKLGVIHSINEKMYKRHVCVPECIKKSPKHIVREFLRGLFAADGSVAPKCIVRLGLRYVDVLRDVQLLLLGFGINSRVTGNPKKAGNGRLYEEHMLVINVEASRLFAREIGFASIRKNDLLQEVASRITVYGKRSVNLMEDTVVSVEPDGEDITYNVTIG